MQFYCLGRNVKIWWALWSLIASHDEDVVRHECRARDSRVIGVAESPFFFLVVLRVTLVTYYVHEIARPNMHEEMLAHSGQKSKIGTWPILPNVTTPNRYSRNNCYCTVDSILLGHDVKEAKQVPWNRNKRVKSAFVQRVCQKDFSWQHTYFFNLNSPCGLQRTFHEEYLSIKKFILPYPTAAFCNDTMTSNRVVGAEGGRGGGSAYQLTLSQPGEAHYAHHINACSPHPPDFQIFPVRHFAMTRWRPTIRGKWCKIISIGAFFTFVSRDL